MKRQAEKSTRAQIELHLMRQRNLGERMAGDHDKPRMWELAAVTALLVFIGVGTLRGWW